MKWSPYQETIFNFVQSEQGNAIVEAVAGSGKTTTIVEALRRIEFQCPDTLFLAFNKAIADELKSRGVNARTFHSLTYGPVTKHLGIRQVDSNKTRKLMNQMMPFEQIRIYGSFISRLVSLAKQMGIGCLCDDIEEQWYNIVEHHDLSLESDKGDITKAVELSRKVFEMSLEGHAADFDDLLYLAVKEGIVLPKFDFVFVDEAQDTNAIQRAILRKVLNPEARMIAVGDPAQAIYGFRGSDSNSLNMIAEEFNCIRLPLTVSYRCPKKIVVHAQQWVDHIQAHENASEGQVINLGKQWSSKDIQVGDMVVCRTVKPIIKLAYKMMKNKNGVAPYVLGRDIGVSMISLIKKMNANNMEGLVLALDEWRKREVEQALARVQESKIQAIEDKYGAIMCIIEGMEESDYTVDQLIETIDLLFSEKGNSAKLCTIHKSKGLENPRVFWINSSMMPPPWARVEWQIEQEYNLCYVATTRAQETLILIEE